MSEQPPLPPGVAGPPTGGIDDGEEFAELDLTGLGDRLVTDDLALAVLTDEELASIGMPPHPDGPGSWFSGLDDGERAVARAAALRSLVARGLLRRTDDAGELDVHPVVDLLRRCREEPIGRCVAVRITADGTDGALVHLVGGGVVLEELVDADGFHACTLRSPERVALTLAAMCDPQQVAGVGDGAVWVPLEQSAPGDQDGGAADEDGGVDPGGAADGTGADPVRAVPQLELDRRAAEIRSAAVTLTELRTVRDDDAGGVLHAALTIVATAEALWGVAGGPGPEDDDAGQATQVLVRLDAAELPSTLLSVLDPLVPMEVDG